MTTVEIRALGEKREVVRFAKQTGPQPTYRMALCRDGSLFVATATLRWDTRQTYEWWLPWEDAYWYGTADFDERLAHVGIEERPIEEALEVEYVVSPSPYSVYLEAPQSKRAPWWRRLFTREDRAA